MSETLEDELAAIPSLRRHLPHLHTYTDYFPASMWSIAFQSECAVHGIEVSIQDEYRKPSCPAVSKLCLGARLLVLS